ncbi:hypothetical protein FUAX_00460 [Fulvitalea axinellae]|uniref:RagB/SusD family nutrient uptake outer membrane protein n=1 Tax=Fulvitalea axinellae TaxID=1182444 RepID=A0AAU9CMS9_9BACT|nr:hypothetical protein FUAX_00460 [Fulvitalea axinellae]
MIRRVFSYMFLLVLFASCKDYLDVVPDNLATIDKAFTNRASSERYLYTCYSFLPAEHDQSANMAFLAGDENWLIPRAFNLGAHYGSTYYWDIARGFQNVSDPIGGTSWVATFNPNDKNHTPTSLFVAIRDCNIFLENIDQPKDLPDYERKRWVAEVKFLKAYYHYLLLRMYGPIPVIRENISPSAEAVNLERRPVSEVVDYIVELLDEALEDEDALPTVITQAATEAGRVTRLVAMAVKAKALVLGASPIFDQNGIMSDLANHDGTKLIDMDPATAWPKAKDALEQAVQACEENGVSLYIEESTTKMSDSTRVKLNIRGAVTERWNQELVWGLGPVDRLQRVCVPKFASSQADNLGAASLLAPTMRMAELFYSKNGVPIDEDKSYDFANRFELQRATEDHRYYILEGHETVKLHFDREPRFYADMFFDGGTYFGSGREDDTKPLWSTRMLAGQVSGKKASQQHSVTGYLVKKLIHPKTVVRNGNTGVATERYPFPVIRLADLYLLYAEALNESGASKDQVLEYVDKVRVRAGLKGVSESWMTHSSNPEKPDSQDGRRAIIKRERLIELAFEGHRFWDLRRWLDAESEFQKPIQGWNVDGETPAEYYRVQTVYPLSFERKDYLFPIRQDEIVKNNALVQNPGW